MTKDLAALAKLVLLFCILYSDASPQSLQADSGQGGASQSAPPTLGGESSQKPGKVYHVGGDVKPPRPVSSVQPALSEEQLKQLRAGKPAKAGSTIVSFVVGPDGTVQNAKVIKSFDHRLDGNAIDAVKKWKFEPATKKGVPVAVELAAEVHFNLYR